MKRFRWEDRGYHIIELYETHVCPTCGGIWELDDSNYRDEECGDCRTMWADGLIAKDTKTPKGKTTARLIARIRYPRGRRCSVDGCKVKGERHHIDYSDPTAIIWLCRKHHAELHSMLRRIK